MKSNIRPVRPDRSATGISSTLPDLKKLVANLSVPARKELFDYLLLLEQQQKPSTDQDRKLSMWCDSLTTQLGNTLGQTHHIFPLAHKPQAKKMLKDVTEFLSVNEMDNLKTEEVKLMYNILARILVSHAAIISARARIPLSMKLVLQTTTPVVALFDNYFPGYVKAKLIRQILLAGKLGINRDHDEEDD